MARRRRRQSGRQHQFRNKLVLNQWVISLFGIDPLVEHKLNGRTVRPFHVLADPIRDPRMEGLDESNIHRFFHNLVNRSLFPTAKLDRMQLLKYEENIVRHTQAINQKRARPVVWKYYQWLTLLFTEVYLDRYFSDRDVLLRELNAYVDRFNRKWLDHEPVPSYVADDLNKLCYQNATGSGKTLTMHVNLLQYQHYATLAGRQDELSRVILLTPNERLSEQHLDEFAETGITANAFIGSRGTLYGASARGLRAVDVMEVTKLADQDGPQQVATRSLGDQNLLLVDEGHRGMSGAEEGTWLRRRNSLCEKGFTLEYSATFQQAVAAANDRGIENAYAKTILFDYSYRYFYEDGFGKDYQILNLPKSPGDAEQMYLTACLLKYYQQVRIYEDRHAELRPFNIEKPLWVFVGSSVTGGKWKNDEKVVATDVARIIQFIADFLHDPIAAADRIRQVLLDKGQDTGLLDENGNDIFDGAFNYLARQMVNGTSPDSLYRDMLARVFNNPAGGTLTISRVKGDAGEIALKCGATEEPFGLINVGDAKGLADHCGEVCKHVVITNSEFGDAMFGAVKESSSPVNLLVGSKKFVEGWDCWRVSTLGLMHVGRSEGSQIIQLFGRGVRLKGWEWSLKRSGKTIGLRKGDAVAPVPPADIHEVETLNVFGIEADFMERFRDFLKEEGLPGNERKTVVTVPLTITYDVGKGLKILRPKQKTSDGREYDFKKDGAVPRVGDVPEYLRINRVVSDWYPRVQAMGSGRGADAGAKHEGFLEGRHIALLDFDQLYFEVEQFKRERSWYNLNVTKAAIREVLTDPSWYRLYIPQSRLEGRGWDDVRLWQEVATELLKRYVDRFYNHRKSEYMLPRLELRPLSRLDENFPDEADYQLIVDDSAEQAVQSIREMAEEIKKKHNDLPQIGDLFACNFDRHLYQPLFHVRKGGKIKVMPVVLNESEYQFVIDLKTYCELERERLAEEGIEVFLLRNMSRGRGAGFFEAQNFHPDFILWLLVNGRQCVTFVEPHGLIHEGPASEKILFHRKIKDIEQRLGDSSIALNSFILSWTRHAQLRWGLSQQELEDLHVLFMAEDKPRYIHKMFDRVLAAAV